MPKTAEKLGLERAFSVMILLMILGSAMRVVNTPLLYVGTLLLGIGIAHMNVLLPSVIRTYFPTKIGPMTSMFTFSMMLATAAGAGLSAPIAAKFDWQTVIIILSCALLMAWIIWLPNDWFSVKQKSFSEKTHVPSKEKSNGIWRNKYAWLLLFFSGMQLAMFYILMAWGPTMAVQTGLSPEIAGAFSGLNSLIGLPAALIVPTIISNMTKRMRQMFISGISALGLLGYVLLLHQVGSFWYWLVVNLLIGISTSVLFPYLMTTFSLKTDSPMQTAELSGMS